ncbi:uncharacterized protein cubi_00983 [Cryptosporidium ubiquitum]|uniref:Secreted protein n=1 Tax=Cryptosporidium ubiquitum TaxID=857276 RepID=A0A1J4M9E7_9CRYT|nr:uncharacterized protein cubi_00983 [Cryptosporidium ubiquitum]OII70838.1 hypothetical protein cubi_00983 [Cryptosporidium ubiquitum]
MKNFRNLFLIITVITIILNSFNDLSQNIKIQSIEYSFLNAQAPEYVYETYRSNFFIKLDSALFAGKSQDESVQSYLSKFGYNGRKDDLKPVCTKSGLESILRTLKPVLSDYYSLVGKNNYFKSIDPISEQNLVAQIDISNYKSSTYPLLVETEQKLMGILANLFRCILSVKAKKFHEKSRSLDSSSFLAENIYRKSMSSISKELILLLKQVISYLQRIYPKCLKKSVGAELVECNATGEALKFCKKHLLTQKEIKNNGGYQPSPPLKGILKNPNGQRSAPTSRSSKKVQFNNDVSLAYID